MSIKNIIDFYPKEIKSILVYNNFTNSGSTVFASLNHNGKIRLWRLLGKGYWLIEYMSVSRIILGSKAQYARAYQYTELDEMDLTYFVTYNLKEIRKALEELKKYIEKKNDEKKRILTLMRNTDYNDRQLFILRDIIDNQKSVFSVQEVEKKYGVSNQTARNDLNHLVERGILETRKNGNRIQFLPVRDVAKKLNLPVS